MAARFHSERDNQCCTERTLIHREIIYCHLLRQSNRLGERLEPMKIKICVRKTTATTGKSSQGEKHKYQTRTHSLNTTGDRDRHRLCANIANERV